MRYRQQAKRIIFVFIVLTLVSSLSTVAFVTGNNLAFASKKGGGGSGDGSKDKGGSSDKGGSGGGSGDNNGKEGSDNSNGGTSSTDNTVTSPPTTDETTQAPPTTEESTPPPATNQQKTCPDGTMVDDSSKCPDSTSTTNTPPAPVDCATNPTDPSCTSTAANQQTPCANDSTLDPTSGDCIPKASLLLPYEAGAGTGGTTTGTTTGTTPAPVDCKANPTDPSCTSTAANTTPPPAEQGGVGFSPGCTFDNVLIGDYKADPSCTSTTNTGGGTTCPPGTRTFDGKNCVDVIPHGPANGVDVNLNPKCQSGYHFVDATNCVPDNFKCPSGTTENLAKFACEPIQTVSAPLATTGTPGTTNTGTGGPTSTTTTTNPPTTSTTTTNVINRGGSSGGGGGSTATTASPAPGQSANNAFLTYVNAVNKITMKYPSTWTKTDLVGNPRIPVMFNAPTATATTPDTAKTSFVISITPAAANLDSFTLQQINALTQSKAAKYTITSTDAKVLTPPTGVTAFREISYDAIRNNNIPLKGAAILFVSGGTGYGLSYLAKQTEYTQNLPMVQQMVNSFQVGAAGGSTSVGPVQSVAAVSGR